jgi:hypothetical protein
MTATGRHLRLACGGHHDAHILRHARDQVSSDRRGFLTAAAAFAAGATVATGTADAKTAQPVTILNGNGIPPRSKGIVGDFYVDDRAHAIYGPKRSSGWGRPTSLIGPQGAPGSNGSTGAAG